MYFSRLTTLTLKGHNALKLIEQAARGESGLEDLPLEDPQA